MSLPAPLALDLDGLDPGELYDTLLAGNPEICRKCCSRLRRTSRIPQSAGHKYHDRSSRIQRHLPPDMEEPQTTDELQEVDYTISERTDGLGTLWLTRAAPSEAELSFCRRCGSTDTREPPERTRSTTELLWVAEGIEESLQAYGVPLDAEALEAEIEALGSQPDWAGDDHGLLTEAVRRAHLQEVEVLAQIGAD